MGNPEASWQNPTKADKTRQFFNFSGVRYQGTNQNNTIGFLITKTKSGSNIELVEKK